MGITDYENMFASTNKILASLKGISKAQVFTIRPRRGASSSETGVDVHYMTGFNRGNVLHVCHVFLYIVIFIYD